MTNVNKTLELLREIERAGSPAVFASSFGLEDMVLTDMIARHFPGIGIFTLDTGRLPEATYALWQQVKQRYGIEFEVYFPESAAVQRYLAKNGPNAFYDSVELRRGCCAIRKVEPLSRALCGKKSWLTGIRRQQSPTRQDLSESSFDSEHGLQKYNPLLTWSEADVWAYLREHQVPYNALHDQGYPSIGCEPCTRAITRGEDIRAGRWWWEDTSNKECGLHRKI